MREVRNTADIPLAIGFRPPAAVMRQAPPAPSSCVDFARGIVFHKPGRSAVCSSADRCGEPWGCQQLNSTSTCWKLIRPTISRLYRHFTPERLVIDDNRMADARRPSAFIFFRLPWNNILFILERIRRRPPAIPSSQLFPGVTMPFGLGMPEILIILVVEYCRSAAPSRQGPIPAKSITEFKKGMKV